MISAQGPELYHRTLLLIPRAITSVLFLCLVQLGIAQDTTQDSARWRIGASLQYGQLTWVDQYELGWDLDPLYLLSFYNDCNQSAKKGSRALTQIGLVLQSRRADQIEVQVGWNDFRFDDLDQDPDFPPSIHCSYTTARLECTRTTSRRGRELKPSFGVRYGASVFYRTGTSQSAYETHFPTGRIEEYKEGTGSVVLLQPTVWCGYRSARILFGVQIHWNVLGYASGELYTNSYSRYNQEETFVDRTDTYAEWLGPDDLLTEGLFWSDICLKLTFNSVGVGKRHSVPEPRQRKAVPKDQEVQPSGR